MNKKKLAVLITSICILCIVVGLVAQSLQKNNEKVLNAKNQEFMYQTCGKVADCIDEYLSTDDISHITQSIGYLHEGYIVSLNATRLALDEGAQLLWLAEEMYDLSFTKENYEAIRYVLAGIKNSQSGENFSMLRKYWNMLSLILQKARAGEKFSIEDLVLEKNRQ